MKSLLLGLSIVLSSCVKLPVVTYEIPPNSGITKQQFYKDYTDCQYKCNLRMYDAVQFLSYSELMDICMGAYKRVEEKR